MINFEPFESTDDKLFDKINSEMSEEVEIKKPK